MMSPASSFFVSHCLMMIRSPALKVGAMDSDITDNGVNPARFATDLESFVASVVKANNAASRMIAQSSTLAITERTFFRIFMR